MSRSTNEKVSIKRLSAVFVCATTTNEQTSTSEQTSTNHRNHCGVIYEVIQQDTLTHTVRIANSIHCLNKCLFGCFHARFWCQKPWTPQWGNATQCVCNPDMLDTPQLIGVCMNSLTEPQRKAREKQTEFGDRRHIVHWGMQWEPTTCT